MRRLLLLGLVVGCTVTLTVDATLYRRPTTYDTADSPPPPLRAEASPGEAPELGSIWVSGHWEWRGTSWRWTPGRWTKPREGYVWEPPVCVALAGTYRYHPGYFRPADEEPPEEYRAPGQIQLHNPSGVRPDVPSRVQIRPNEPAPETTWVAQRPDPVAPDTEREVGANPELGGGEPLNPRVGAGQDGVTGPTAGEAGTQTVELTCSLPIARVPRAQGRFVINGTGFDLATVVKVGGTVQSIRSTRPTSLDVNIDRGGVVTVQRGQTRVECGSIELF